MPSLIEMMEAAQGGAAMNNLASQFGLSPDKTREAVTALLPAFSMGLQKQAESTAAFGNLLQSMVAGPHVAAFTDPRTAMAPETVAAGQDALSQLFGSQAVSQQVAQHAANVSGLSSSLLQQMMPVIASMLLGGLLKGTTGNNGLGGILGQMMGGAGGLGGLFGQMMGGAPAGQPAQPGAAGGFGDILSQMFGQGAQPGSTGQAQMPSGLPQMPGNLGDLLGQMFGQGAQPGAAAPSPAPEPEPAPQATPGDPVTSGLDMLKSMFETGTQIQDANLKGLQDIFAKMPGGTPR
jgi:hypothetical protein